MTERNDVLLGALGKVWDEEFPKLSLMRLRPDQTLEVRVDGITKKRYLRVQYYQPCGKNCTDPNVCGQHAIYFEIGDLIAIGKGER